MSTKIYDGLIAVNQSPFTVLRKARKVIDPLWHDRFGQAFAEANAHPGEPWSKVFPLGGSFALRGQDGPWDRPIPELRFELLPELYKLIMALQRWPGHTFTSLDFGYDFLIIPNGRGLEYCPLVMVFSEAAGAQYRKALIDAGVVQEYGYWNNTDEPEGMSEKEWRQRAKAWSFDVPITAGLGVAQPTRFDADVELARRLRAALLDDQELIVPE